MPIPKSPKIYHIVHLDRLPAIVDEGFLWSDAHVADLNLPGTSIGYRAIKQRRLSNPLSSIPGLNVGCCEPFLLLPSLGHALCNP